MFVFDAAELYGAPLGSRGKNILKCGNPSEMCSLFQSILLIILAGIYLIKCLLLKATKPCPQTQVEIVVFSTSFYDLDSLSCFEYHN